MIEDIVKSDLKTILHSKRANLYYLEKCRIMQKDGRIVYLTETKKENLFWNIPIANTTVILLGSGTSVTQAATTLWVLGIPHGFAVMHGKTRRGALVFDVADLIKDAIVLPWSFICAMRGQRDREFRQICLQKFTEHKALDFMFDEVKRCSRLYAGGERS